MSFPTILPFARHTNFFPFRQISSKTNLTLICMGKIDTFNFQVNATVHINDLKAFCRDTKLKESKFSYF